MSLDDSSAFAAPPVSALRKIVIFPRERLKPTFKPPFVPKDISVGSRSLPFHSAIIFIMESIEVFVPPEDTNTALIAWVVFGATVGLVLLFWRLLAADKRRALELQRELTRRRRARRERSDHKLDLATDGPSPNEP